MRLIGKKCKKQDACDFYDVTDVTNPEKRIEFVLCTFWAFTNETLFTWERNLGMSLTQGNVQVQAGKVHALVHETMQNGEVERPPEVG